MNDDYNNITSRQATNLYVLFQSTTHAIHAPVNRFMISVNNYKIDLFPCTYHC